MFSRIRMISGSQCGIRVGITSKVFKNLFHVIELDYDVENIILRSNFGSGFGSDLRIPPSAFIFTRSKMVLLLK